MDGDSSQFIDVVGTDSQAAPIIHESGSPPHPDGGGGSPHEANSQPHPDGGSQCLDVSDGGEEQGMDDSVIVIPGSPRRGGGGQERDVSIIDISDSSKVPVPRYITIHYDTGLHGKLEYNFMN